MRWCRTAWPPVKTCTTSTSRRSPTSTPTSSSPRTSPRSAQSTSTGSTTRSFTWVLGEGCHPRPSSLDDVIESIRLVGDVLGVAEDAARLVDSPRRRLDSLASALRDPPPRDVVVLEWTDPPFSAGTGSPMSWLPVAARRCSRTGGRPGAHRVAGGGARAAPTSSWSPRAGTTWNAPWSLPGNSSTRAGSRAAPRSGRSTPTATSCGRDRAWWRAPRSWPGSCTPTAWEPRAGPGPPGGHLTVGEFRPLSRQCRARRRGRACVRRWR